MAAVQMNVVEFHTWNAVKTAITKPDRMLFDLDPGEGVVAWAAVQQAAQLVRVMLQEIGLQAWLKTSGGKRLHVVVRRYAGNTIGSLLRRSQRQSLNIWSKRCLSSLSIKAGQKNLVGKIFVDYLRNGFGAMTVAAWSARVARHWGIGSAGLG
jgi:bifunctional non-homologous end joining protein LigD